MARRRKSKKDPSGADVIFGLIGLLVFLAFAGKVTGKTSFLEELLGQLVGFLFWGLLLVAFIGVLVWFIRGLLDNGLTSRKVGRQRSTTSTKAASLRENSSPIPPEKWSQQLIRDVEWRVFEKLCIALWRE